MLRRASRHWLARSGGVRLEDGPDLPKPGYASLPRKVARLLQELAGEVH
jgi:hypothetical protein